MDEGLLRWLRSRGVESVVDVGCGTGGMVRRARELGFRALGVEGDAGVPKECEEVVIHDFADDRLPGSVDREWDCLYTCEVLEHIPEDFFDRTVSQIVRRSAMVVMTCAPPGWGGFNHVNEQGHEYWVRRMDGLGFRYDAALTRECRSRSTMNAHRPPRKQFVKHRALVFVPKAPGEELVSCTEETDGSFVAHNPSGAYFRRRIPVATYSRADVQ